VGGRNGDRQLSGLQNQRENALGGLLAVPGARPTAGKLISSAENDRKWVGGLAFLHMEFLSGREYRTVNATENQRARAATRREDLRRATKKIFTTGNEALRNANRTRKRGLE
jgi:hypothetical protein